MPAQIGIPFPQLETIYDTARDAGEVAIVLTEGPVGGQALDVWIIDEESASSQTHRSVVVDTEGVILGDTRESDY